MLNNYDYSSFPQRDMKKFSYKKSSKNNYIYHEWIYCINELIFYKLLDNWNKKYYRDYIYTTED